MRRIGKVVQLTSGLIIVRSEDDRHPPFGSSLVNDRLETVGRVVDVFGPITNPYIALTPVNGRTDPETLGERVYFRS